ncbi:uncharacterized protein LOC144256819 isoform X3 [Urocitellus parryii]
MTSRFRLPAGRTYNVRASELARDRQNTEVVCNILLLDNTVQAFKVNKNELGQVLLDIVFKHLDLTERDYFGLQLADDSTDNPSDSEQHQEMCAASESVEINASTKKGISELGKVHRGLCEHFKHMNKIEDSLPIRAKLTMETWNFKLAESHVGRSSNVEHKRLHDMDETAYNQQKDRTEPLWVPERLTRRVLAPTNQQQEIPQQSCDEDLHPAKCSGSDVDADGTGDTDAVAGSGTGMADADAGS